MLNKLSVNLNLKICYTLYNWQLLWHWYILHYFVRTRVSFWFLHICSREEVCHGCYMRPTVPSKSGFYHVRLCAVLYSITTLADFNQIWYVGISYYFFGSFLDNLKFGVSCYKKTIQNSGFLKSTPNSFF